MFARFTLAAVLLSGHANAQTALYPALPPPEYDRPYTGRLIVSEYDSWETIRDSCNKPGVKGLLGCAFVGETACHIVLPSRESAAKLGWDQSILYRHEIGHCNGWETHHPGGTMMRGNRPNQ